MNMPPRFLYRLFPIAGKPSRWFARRLPPQGRLLSGLFIGSALFGIDIRQTIAYQLAGLAAGLLAASIVLSIRWRPKIQVKRVLPDLATSGAPTCYWLELTNRGARIEYGLSVQEILPTPRIEYEAFLAARNHLEPSRNRFDRGIGFPRWAAMRHRARGIEASEIPVPALVPGHTTRLKVEITPARRGWISFGMIELRRPDPLGLFNAVHREVLSESLLSLPNRYRVPSFPISSHRHYQPGGVSLATAVGDSQEFAGLRDYRPGDSRKHIHWRSYARTGRLVVKEYQDEYFDRHALLVDTEMPPEGPAVFEELISTAASIVVTDRPQDSILDLVFIGQNVFELTQGRGLGDTVQALTYLAEAVPSAQTDFKQLAALFKHRAGQLASAILVLSRWDRQRSELATALRSAGLPILCLVVTGDVESAQSSISAQVPNCYALRGGHVATDLERVVWN